MSVQTVVFNRSKVPLTHLPNVLIKSVLNYLKAEKDWVSPYFPENDRLIVTMATRVCKDWTMNGVFKEEQVEASKRLKRYTVCRDLTILARYPQEIVRLFRECKTPIERSPFLHLDNQNGGSNAVDFLPFREMNQPVMRFIVDPGRPGIALHIQGNKDADIRQEWDGEVISFKDVNNVLFIFKRTPDPDDNDWTYEFGNQDRTIEMVYLSRHQSEHIGELETLCPTCPFDGQQVHPTVLRKLLLGKDSDFILPGHVPLSKGRNNLSQASYFITALAVAALAYMINYYFTLKQNG